ncbi:MAG: hypothetical protein A3C53_00065 [Omnitrophica WOR_2 bacterium RIFCSPHIGHO2_02_FULL_68_15]|nr:MAG: hypothetical protein A3C53_00065 [Omnitrophica WOR_2 bacterium RIFCSPHIGHO2_02_FULL_68_15]
MTWVDWWGRRWVQTAAAVLLLIYAVLRIQIAVYDRKIRAGEAELARLRPVVLEAVQATESQATVAAQERFAEQLKASVVAWEPVFQRLASAVPPTMVVHTMGIDGTHLTLQGLLRHPPADPQPYLAAVAAALKRQGVLQTATVAVGPRDADDPSVIRVDVTGELQ